MAITRITNIANTIPDASIANEKLSDIVNFKNIIINGDMSIAQRSTSVAGITTSGYNTLDRIRVQIGTAGTWTQSQSTDVPTGQGFATSLKMECTTANASLNTNSDLQIQQRLEGQMLQYLKKGTANAESVTASFWVKSNKTGTYIYELRDLDNSRSISKSYTINSADTWEKKTVTFAGDTTGVLDNDNAESFRINFHLAAGTDFTSGTLQTSWGSTVNANRAVGQVNLADATSNYINITGVQLEAGDTASEFEFLPYDVNLGRCQRYYTKSYEDGTFAGASTGYGGLFGGRLANSYGNQPVQYRFFTKMRVLPTVTSYSLTGTSGAVSDTTTTAGSPSSDVSVTLARISQSGIGYFVGWTGAGGSGWGFQFTADAEL